MKYSLDTNTCIRYLNGRSASILQKLPTVPARDIVVCSVVRGELAYGAAKSQTPETSAAKQQRFLRPYSTLPYDDAAAMFGHIRTALEKLGTPIGPYDMQIAAVALVHGLIVVTHNVDEFGRVEGLQIEDWDRISVGKLNPLRAPQQPPLLVALGSVNNRGWLRLFIGHSQLEIATSPSSASPSGAPSTSESTAKRRSSG